MFQRENDFKDMLKHLRNFRNLYKEDVSDEYVTTELISKQTRILKKEKKSSRLITDGNTKPNHRNHDEA